MMKFLANSRVVGVRATKTVRLIHDGGILTVKSGEWLFVGDHFGPVSAGDWEDLDLELISKEEGKEEEGLRKALEKGQL